MENEQTLEKKVAEVVKQLWGRVPEEFKNDKDLTFTVGDARCEDFENNFTTKEVELGIHFGGEYMGYIMLDSSNYMPDFDTCPLTCFSHEEEKGFYCPDGEGRYFGGVNKELEICPYTTKCDKVRTFLKDYDKKYNSKKSKSKGD